jgi:hypothetical protein
MIEIALKVAAALWGIGSGAILFWALTRRRAWWSNLLWWERSGIATVVLLWPIYLLAVLGVSAYDWWTLRRRSGRGFR